MLRKMLSEHGCRVRTALNGAIALKSIKTDPPDLILLDILMPEMGGYEMCGVLKSDKRTGHIPIIFISALSDVEDIVKGFRAGGVDYITKPLISQAPVVKASSRDCPWR